MLLRATGFVLLVTTVLACRHPRAVTPPQVLEGTYLSGARLPLRDGPGGRIVATTHCAPSAILAREGHGLRVRSFSEDGTFVGEGIVDDADVARAQRDPKEREACGGGLLVSRSDSVPEHAAAALLPPGLTRVDLSASWSGEGDVFHGRDCARSTGDGTNVRESDDLREPSPRHVERTWGFAFDDQRREILLTGPEEVVSVPGHAPIRQTYLCLRSFVVVGKHDGALVLLRHSAPMTTAVVVAYDPTDVELWYPSKEACLRDNPPLPPQLAAELARGHGCS